MRWNARATVLMSGAAVVALGLPLGSHEPSTAMAAGPTQEWFVAQSGTANFGSGSSCAAPDVVGSDDTAIRTVLSAVVADDTITICNGVYAVTQTLVIDDSITIQGQSTASTILDGGDAVQIMRIDDSVIDASTAPEVSATILTLTFRDGNTGSNGTDNCNTRSQCGGAIYVEDGSSLTVHQSSFEGNRASFIGGAIANNGEDYNGGTIRIYDSMFYGNTANLDGGAIGISFNAPSPLTVVNSTFVANRALSRHGGAISESFSGGSISSSTFVDNIAPDGNGIRGSFTVRGSVLASRIGPICGSGTNNIDSSNVATSGTCAGGATTSTPTVVTYDSLNLRGLGNWGGPTETVWIGPGSSAVDANTGTCQALDQRGATRSASPCDAGAFERQGASDEAIVGTLTYTDSLFVEDTALPSSSPSFAGGGRTTGYASLTPDVCSVDDASGEATGLLAGTCQPQWYLAPTLLLDGAAKDDTLTISRASQAALVVDPVTEPLVFSSFTPLSVSGGSGTGFVVLDTGMSTGCFSPFATFVYVTDPSGTCTVTATKFGDDRYDSATSPPITVPLAKAEQFPLDITAPASLRVGESAVLSTSGGSSGEPVTFSATPPSRCTVDGDVLLIVGGGSCEVSATMAGNNFFLPVSATGVTVQGSLPPPAVKPSAPRDVSSAFIIRAVTVSWREPASSGDFAVTHYQVESRPAGGNCLVRAPSLTCDISGLKPGQEYRFVVRALNGGGWSEFSRPGGRITIPTPVEASISITGSRSGREIVIVGQARGLDAGLSLVAWSRPAGASEFVPSSKPIVVGADGSFTWDRRARKAVRVYVATAGGEVTSRVIRVASQSSTS